LAAGAASGRRGLGELVDAAGVSRPNGQTWVVLAEAGGLPAAAAGSSAWISPAHSETEEIVGISPVMSSSRGCAQPAQAEPGGCAKTSTKSRELAPAQTQPAAARRAAHRDAM